MTVREMIEVLEAFERGETIECHHKANERGWMTVSNPSWDFYAYVYRVKPKPREWWVNEYNDGVISQPHESKEKALAYSGSNYKQTIHIREVLEEADAANPKA